MSYSIACTDPHPASYSVACTDPYEVALFARQCKPDVQVMCKQSVIPQGALGGRMEMVSFVDVGSGC
jgi:hypothetical protein